MAIGEVSGDSMRIKSLEFYAVRLPFRFAFKHNLASRTFSQNLVVRAIVTSDERTEFEGWGESVPRDYVTGETTESALLRLKSEYAPRLANQKFPSPNEVIRTLKDEFYDLGLDERPLGASWCALELAVLDAVARANSLILSRWLSRNDRQEVEAGVVYGGVLPFASARILPLALWLYRFYGFKTVKLKVGENLEDDLARVKKARAVLGDGVTLRVDANAAWTVDRTMRFAERARPFKVVSIEQPVAASDLEGLAKLSSSLPEQIVADESLCTVSQAQTLAYEKIVSGFNIRLSKVGGFLAACEIAEIGRRAGIALHLGAQVGESGILSAAGRAFAQAQGPFENCEGSANFFLLKQDLTKENLTTGLGGFGKPISKPGLAVTVPPKKLNDLVVDRQTEIKNGSSRNALMRC
jgi:muconate cycloisomerase